MTIDLNSSRLCRLSQEWPTPSYGLVNGDGVVDLSARFGARWPTLRSVLADGALSFGWLKRPQPCRRTWLIDGSQLRDPRSPTPRSIICVGVNFPDRNEEYKDGQAAPSNPSLFVRFPRPSPAITHR
jgi:2-keto-4-pentenoate hydratase/2-oxohepta-3-ene-1,7-dioic acid hydratase in catechol pathway